VSHIFSTNQRVYAEAPDLLSPQVQNCPKTHTPVAKLTIRLACLRQARIQAPDKKSPNASAQLWWTAIALTTFTVCLGTVLALSYLGCQLLQQMQAAHQLAAPTAAYSDIARYSSGR